MVDPESPKTTIRRCGACKISKATRAQAHVPCSPCTNTHTQASMHAHAITHQHARTHTHIQKYVIFIPFPRPEWLRERACLVNFCLRLPMKVLHSALFTSPIFFTQNHVICIILACGLYCTIKFKVYAVRNKNCLHLIRFRKRRAKSRITLGFLGTC